MRTLQTIVLIVFFAYGGFMVGYFLKDKQHSPPAAEVAKTVKPITDWEKFYDHLKNNKRVRLCVGVAPLHPRCGPYDLYLVDGKEWIKIGHGGVRGCGREQEVYYAYFGLTRLEEELVAVPSAAAKFVAVGPGGFEVRDFRIEYPEDE